MVCLDLFFCQKSLCNLESFIRQKFKEKNFIGVDASAGDFRIYFLA